MFYSSSSSGVLVVYPRPPSTLHRSFLPLNGTSHFGHLDRLRNARTVSMVGEFVLGIWTNMSLVLPLVGMRLGPLRFVVSPLERTAVCRMSLSWAALSSARYEKLSGIESYTGRKRVAMWLAKVRRLKPVAPVLAM